jgi:hypothetical protein
MAGREGAAMTTYGSQPRWVAAIGGSAERPVWQTAAVAMSWIVALTSAAWFVAGSAAPERAVIHVSAYTLSYLVAGTAAWIRQPGNRTGALMLAVSRSSVVTRIQWWGGLRG